MSTQSTETSEHDTGETESTSTDAVARVKRIIDAEPGSLLIGAALLVVSLWTHRRGKGGELQGLIGLALVAVGLRQRWADREETPSIETDDQNQADDVSAEAAVDQPLHDVEQQAEGNPRDVSKASDVETDEDEGDIQFSREQDIDPRQEPELDETEVEDPRHSDDVDDESDVEIDISKAAMADEPNEAAGPTSVQTQPTTTKDDDTVPTDSSPVTEDASDMRVDSENDSEDGADGESESESDDETESEADDETEDRETFETEGGASVHTDTMEAGTMDIDEDDVTDSDDELNEESTDSEESSNPRTDDESETES